MKLNKINNNDTTQAQAHFFSKRGEKPAFSRGSEPGAAFFHRIKEAPFFAFTSNGPAIQMTEEDCPSRDNPAEARHARRDPMNVEALAPPDSGLLISNFNINSSRVKADLGSNANWISFLGTIGTDGNAYDMIGYTDCEGASTRNTVLRQERVDHVFDELPGPSRSAVNSRRPAPLSEFLFPNDTLAHRERNRSVFFSLESTSFPEEPVRGISCDDASIPAAGVSSISDYIGLILCAESRSGLGARDMLSLLRQLYYSHTSWANTTRSQWRQVIPCFTTFAHPNTILGRPLTEALQNSQVIGSTDIGHIFTGLEAMACPSSDVTFPVAGGLTSLTAGLPNEAFATWAGDLGSAAGQKYIDEDNGISHPWRHYFGTPGSLSSWEDMRGDIEAYGMRAGLSGRPCNTTALAPAGFISPISSMFQDYYFDSTTTLGATHDDIYRCFIHSQGGRTLGNRIVNRRDITGPMSHQIDEFARLWVMKKHSLTFDTMELFTKVLRVLDFFLDWLESHM